VESIDVIVCLDTDVSSRSGRTCEEEASGEREEFLGMSRRSSAVRLLSTTLDLRPVTGVSCFQRVDLKLETWKWIAR